MLYVVANLHIGQRKNAVICSGYKGASNNSVQKKLVPTKQHMMRVS